MGDERLGMQNENDGLVYNNIYVEKDNDVHKALI